MPTILTEDLNDFGKQMLATPIENRPKEIYKYAEELISDYRLGLSCEVISKKHNVSVSYISTSLRRLGVKMRHGWRKGKPGKLRINIDPQRVVDLYVNQKKSLVQIAKILGVSKTYPRQVLKRLNIPRRSLSVSHQRYNFDKHYFDVVDSQEKAYFLGLYMADGFNGSSGEAYVDKRIVKISLQKRDDELLIKLKVALKAEHPLKYYKLKTINKKTNTVVYREYCLLAITNEHFSKALAALGFVYAKSLILKFPNISEEYHSSFMLGFHDGNGHVLHNKICNSTGIELVSTKEFLTRYQEILMANCQVNKVKLMPDGNPDTVYRFHYEGNTQARRIFSFLYSKSPVRLSRKYNKFKEILGITNDDILPKEAVIKEPIESPRPLCDNISHEVFAAIPA